MIFYAVLLGFALDLIFGDPSWLPHPVVYMGRAIAGLENFLRRILPKTKVGELTGGFITVICLTMGSMVFFGGICAVSNSVNNVMGFIFQSLWCWQALALKGLAQESKKVYAELKNKDLTAARTAVSRIVGRDTNQLTEEGVTKATVETVAENFSDGVVAPLFYMLIGGAPLAMVYKAINTMDSMIGYKNEKYLYFGRAAAKLDDLANYIPSRLAALLWIAGSAIMGFDGKNSYKIWCRDCRNHASPNSAQTESACAGALGVRLAGPAYYFGQLYEKPYIGDELRKIEAEDIIRANRMLYASGFLAAASGLLVRMIVFGG